MPLTLSDVLTSATVDEWETEILNWATSLGLTATSWQPGGVARTIIAVMANALAAADEVTTGIAAGGYLDTAATVTPEYGPGWLDLVAQYVFGLTRTPATQGTSTCQLINSGAPIGPIPAGAYHLQAASGHTYTNIAAITIAGGGASTTIALVCDQVGVSDAAATALTPITVYAGVTSGGLITAAIGSPGETNAALISRCRDKLGALAPKLGNASSYRYFALTTTESGYPLPTAPITRVRVAADTFTGAVTVVLANASGAPTGGDVAAMQTYLDDVATPDSATMTCVAATQENLQLVMQAYCPVAYSAQVVTDVTAAWLAYVASLDIGGQVLVGGAYGIPIEGLENFIARRVTYLRTQVTTINGSPNDYLFSVVSPGNKVGVSTAVTVTYAGV